MRKELTEIDADVLALARELRFEGYFDSFVDTYSLGTKQKLCILLALLGEPTLIVLDEAFNGLDPASALQVKHHLQHRLTNGRCAVLLATPRWTSWSTTPTRRRCSSTAASSANGAKPRSQRSACRETAPWKRRWRQRRAR